ncbi:hypothetical protein, partial [Phytoactinopolyspora endophytica]|uniref:hypothetical protein n=1 Tax=Phytoactinopolyspora endophytica TaxID=1642495 RepID=UPI00197B770D
MQRSLTAAGRTVRRTAVAVAAAGIALVASAVVAPAASTVPIGAYTGTSDAYTDATVAFDVDSDGRMSGFDTASYIQCGWFPTPIAWADMPPTPVNADTPFDVEWTFSDVEYELSGTIDASGNASGTGKASMPSISCSGYEFSWTAQADDPVVYDPDANADPTELTVTELAETGVTVTGTDFAPDSTVTFEIGGSQVETSNADGDGAVTFDYTSTTLGTGTHTATLTSPDGTADTT